MITPLAFYDIIFITSHTSVTFIILNLSSSSSTKLRNIIWLPQLHCNTSQKLTWRTEVDMFYMMSVKETVENNCEQHY